MLKINIILILLLIIPIPNDEINVHSPTVINSPIGQRFSNFGHVGVDLSIPVGTDLYVDLDGEVIETAEDSRCYGRYLMILHEDGNASLYAQLSKILIERGDEVKAGDLIALSGGDPKDTIDGDGWSTGAHLHWEVRIKEHLNNNLYNIDPIKYLAQFYFNTELPKWMENYLNYEE